MTTNRVNSVAIIGAGTMGPGMAVVFAVHGYEARLMDINAEILDRAKNTVEVVFNVLKGNGFITEDQIAAARPRLTFTLDQETAVAGVDLVAEAIPESLELKHTFYREVEMQVGADTILASNTSGIPITSLSTVCKRPERVIGMHWSNPPHIIPVIEVIKGEQTADETVTVLWEVIEDIEMLPVLVKRDVAGFVENRVLYAIMRECLHLLETGVATPEDIDTVVKWGIGYKLAVIGPMELLDVAGLDIYNSVASYLNATLSNESSVSETITERVDAGRLGIKTMGGLFDYEPGEIPSLMQRRMNLLLETKKVLADWL